MTQMYVITESGGSYDDAWSTSRFVTDDYAKGCAFVDAKMAIVNAVNAAQDSLNKFTDTWIAKKPQPGVSIDPKFHVPRWPSNVKVTQEMRDERKRLEDLNNADIDEKLKPYRLWQEEYYAARAEFINSFPPEVAKAIGKETSWWGIEEIATL